MQENVELIRLEREIKEKSNKLEIMQSKFHNVQQVSKGSSFIFLRCARSANIFISSFTLSLITEVNHADFLKNIMVNFELPHCYLCVIKCSLFCL